MNWTRLDITPMGGYAGDPGKWKDIRELNTRCREIATAAPARARRRHDMYASILADALRPGHAGGGLGEVLHPVRIAGNARICIRKGYLEILKCGGPRD